MSAFEINDFNRGVVDDFRANDGKATGQMEGVPLILVTHRGEKSGKEYTSPLVYTRAGDDYVVIASKGGSPEDPQWLRNLVANPNVTVEVGDEKFPAVARVAEGDERDRLYQAQAEQQPQFAEYQSKTDRVIPVVVLSRADS